MCIDFDGYNSKGVYDILYGDAFWTAYYGGDWGKSFVHDSNGGAWRQRRIDIIVPATVEDRYHVQCVPDKFVDMVQAAPWNMDATASTVWFADIELYINPG